MAIIKGEITISKAITENGEMPVIDVYILDHKLNSIRARYTFDDFANFYGLLVGLLNDYINEEIKK